MLTDAQAGAESALALFNAINSGINFVLHSAGILGGYISMSFEKFILDEEVGAMIRRMIRPTEFNDNTIDKATIQKVGPGGHYLTDPKTFKLCSKEVYQTSLMNRQNVESWQAAGSKNLEQVATEKVKERLAAYAAPDFPESMKKDLMKKAQELAGNASLKVSL